MSSSRFLVLCLALAVGCTPVAGDDDDTPPPGPPPDPHVDSYLPDGYGASDPARVIFVGDSISAGVGATASGLSYPELLVENDSDWPDYDDVDLESLFGDMDVIDLASGGATTDSMLSQQLPSLSGQLGASVSGESIVVFTVGGNDMQSRMIQILTGGDDVANAAIAEIRGNLEDILDYFDDGARFPDGAFVYFTNVYEPTDAQGLVDGCFFGIDIGPVMHNFEDANDAFREVAIEHGMAMVDLRGHFLGHGFHGSDPELPDYHADDPTLWFDDDCIHPNDRGHHELRRLFHAAIAGQPLALEP